MSGGGVDPGEMDAHRELDESATEAIVSGRGHDVDARLAGLVDDLRRAFVSQPPAVGEQLAAVMAAGAPEPAAPTPSRRFERMRSPHLARLAAAAATLFAATGGLAVAHALPAPVQDAVSHLGVGAPAHHGHGHGDAHDAAAAAVTSSTTEPATTPTTGTDATDGGEPTTTVPAGVVPGGDGSHGDGCDAPDGGGEQEGDGTTTTVAPTTTSVPAVAPAPCTPTSTTVEPAGGHDGGDPPDQGTVSTVPGTSDGGSDGGTTVSTVPSAGGDGDQSTTTTVAPSGDGGSGSHDGGSDSSNG